MAAAPNATEAKCIADGNPTIAVGPMAIECAADSTEMTLEWLAD